MDSAWSHQEAYEEGNQIVEGSDQMSESPYKLLTRWRDLVANQDFAVPSDVELRAIVDRFPAWPGERVSAIAVSWRATIHALLTAAREGVDDPIAALPVTLRRPADSAATAAVGDTDAESTGDSRPRGTSTSGELYEALLAWRDAAVQAGRIDAGLFPNIKLSQIANNGKTGNVDAGRELRPPQKPYAEELNAVTRRYLAAAGTGAGSDRPAEADGAGTAAGSPADPTPGAGPEANPLTASSTDRERAWLESARFAPTDLQVETATAVVDVGARFDGDGSVALSWDAAGDAEVRVYRVVTADDYPPVAPEYGQLIATTIETSVADARQFTSPVRHVRIWCNAGPTVREALSTQPFLHGEATVVSPVQEPRIVEDNGRIIGTWDVPEGADRVRVYRVPSELNGRGVPMTQFQILAEDDNLGGFVDRAAKPGVAYSYHVRVEVSSDGVAMLSPDVQLDIRLQAVLVPVDDLRASLNAPGDQLTFDLEWTPPPVGKVRIHRSAEEPKAGLTARELDEAALDMEGTRLSSSTRLADPERRVGDGRRRLTEVPVPEDWPRVYFTPVTTLAGRVRVGHTVAVSMPPRVTALNVIERVDEQLITFTWPTGAASVYVYLGPRGTDFRTVRDSRPVAEISRETYLQQGGLHLAHPLPSAGCSVHVVPTTFQDRRRIEGIPATADYPGLLRVRYQISVQRNLMRAFTSARVDLVADVDVAHPPSFALVMNPDRFPLHIDDGTPVMLKPAGDELARPQSRFTPTHLSPNLDGSGWSADAKAIRLPSFVRLFVDLPTSQLARVAVLDPPVTQLWLQ